MHWAHHKLVKESGRKELEGEGVGIPLPHQGVLAFLGFKISDLVHTFGEFNDVHAAHEEGMGGEGVSPSHTREFLYF